VKVSLNWLKRYVDINEDADTLAGDLTMFGLNVEGIERSGARFTGVVFGKVLECGKHPAADKLSVCAVDTGGTRPLNIVCGAPNVRTGLNVAVAVEGAVLPGDFRIKKTKLRGETSEGMICSHRELGTGEDASGIIELDFEMNPGDSLEGRLGKGDAILDIEVTPNRPDQLSHFGVAREIAALYNRKLREPERIELSLSDSFRIEIEDFGDCPRFSVALVDDVKIGPSPDWMKDLLASVGGKSINNIVDVTNFVLLETGQPLHAYDLDKLSGNMICARRARQDEKLRTLDDVQRDLDPGVMVIADQDRPLGVAGVMGGADSEVRENTRRILLESAMFDPRAVRGSSRRLKLDTEASYRFERESDIGDTVRAIERACWLIKAAGAGVPRPVYSEKLVSPERIAPRIVSLRAGQANRLMGTHLDGEDLASLLGRLGLSCEWTENTVSARIPSFRRDLKEEVDLIEEAARVYGYDNMGREVGNGRCIYSRIAVDDYRNESIAAYLSSRGFAEVINSSFMDPNDLLKFEWSKNDPSMKPLAVENPLSSAQSILRTSLLPGMLKVIGRNAPVEQEGIRIFEMAKVFIPVTGGESLPDEQLHLAVMFTRKSSPAQWSLEQRQSDFFDMKGELEALFERFNIPSEIQMARAREKEPDYIFEWALNNGKIAECGMIPGRICGEFDVDTPVYYFMIDLEVFHAAGMGEPRYAPISPYPAVRRDLCVVAPGRVTFGDIRKVVEKRAKFLEFIRLFDYYRGGNLEEDKRSYSFRMAFRSAEGTLDDATVDRVIGRILDGLERELQVQLRT